MTRQSRTRSSRIHAVAGLLLAALLAAPAVWGQGQSGTWTKKGFDIAGTWSIVDDGGQLFVVLDGKFRTKKAPDLKIFLSPTQANQLGNRNATKGSLKIAQLDSHQGAQRYPIPAGTDLSKYRSILIHCEKYTKLWGVADLR